MRDPNIRPFPQLAIILPVALLIALLLALSVAAQPVPRLAASPTADSWTTGGPYGGQVNDLVVNPVTPTVAYALLHNAGVYVTSDGGTSWRPSLIDPWPQGMTADAVDPNLVYFAGQQNVYRSPDGGGAWERIDNFMQPGPYYYPLAHPISTGVLYLGVGVPVNRTPVEGEPTGVFRWEHATGKWITLTTDLTDTLVTSLAFDPSDTTDPLTMVAGTRNGNVFYSEDAGETWVWRAKVDEYVYRLVYNPLTSGEVWALTKDPVGWTEPPTLYRSTDATLQAWEAFAFPDTGSPIWVRSVAFDVPRGTAYLALHGQPPFVSTDGGDAWAPMAGAPPDPTCFGMDGDGVRYVGTYQRGVYVSTGSGGWEQASQGLAGVLPEAMVAIPGQPEIAYAYAPTLGMLRTSDGGQSWEEIDAVRRWGFPWRDSVLAAEGGPDARVYLGSGCGDAPCLKVGDVAGGAWVTRTLPTPGALEAGWTADVFAVYADASQPGRVLAGITFYPPDVDITIPKRPLGAVYRSDDRGVTWEIAYDITAALPISGIVEFASSPAAPEVIYAATDGTGLLRSTDGGGTWEPITGWSGPSSLRSIAVDPVDPLTVYAAAYDPEGQTSPGIYVSRDGGSSWELMPGSGGNAWTLHMSASEPPVLYLGTWGGGVMRLEANGSWSPVVEVPERSNVFAIASASDAERAIVYVGLTGDSGSPEGLQAGQGAMLRADEARSGGIYQMVAPHVRPLYLPLAAAF